MHIMNYLNNGGSWVKVQKYKNQLLIVMLAVGFFVGILYENLISIKLGKSVDLFQAYFLEQYAQTKIQPKEYLWYVLKARILPMLGMIMLGCLKWKKIITCIVTAWTGFLLGVVMVASMIHMGLKGIVFCLVGMMPHMICYVLAYSVLVLYLFQYPKQRWRVAKSIFIILCMGTGIVLETYLNPVFMRWLIRMM